MSLVTFFAAGQQPEMSPEEYLKRNLGSGGTALPWLLPLLYVLLALTLVSWAGMRHSNRSRRGRALFVFTVGIVLIVLASAFFLLRAAGTTQFVGVGAAATLLGCAMLVVAAGSLLPSVEDWFGARHELRTIQPLLTELGRRHPDVGIGVRPRGPLVFRVAERMSLISDALFLEATAADAARKRPVDATGARPTRELDEIDDVSELESPPVPPQEQARTIAQWIYAGREGAPKDTSATFPGLGWLRQPTSYSDREWILEIAQQYRQLALSRVGVSERPRLSPDFAGRRVVARGGLIVQVLLATQLVDLLNNVLLGLGGQPDGARRNTANTLVAHIRQPGQFLVELLVVLVVGEVGRLDTEEVGKCGHGGCRGVGAVA